MPLPPDLQQPLDAIISSIYHLQTSAGGRYKRAYSAIFRDLPDRFDYPDYYELIKEPRCLHGIMNSLKQGAYSSPQAVAYDLLLIWSNAKEYNQQGSMVYADAEKLETYMQRLWDERTPPLPPFASLPRPGNLPPTASTLADPNRKVKRIKLTGASIASPAPATPAASLAASGSTKLRLAGPSASSSSSPAPVPGTPSFTVKLGGNRVAPPATPGALPPLPTGFPQLPPVPSAAPSSGRAPSQPPASAGKKAEKDDDDEGTPAALVPTIPDTESGWMGGDLGPNSSQVYLDIVNKIRNYTDASNRPLATPLIALPDPVERPDYYEAVTNPVSLDSIEEKIKSGAYPTPEAFDRDLHHLFEIMKIFIRPESGGTLYSDLMVLQRLYQELTKRRSALERSSHIDDAAALSSVGGGPGNVKREDEPGSATDLKSRATTRPTTKDKIFLDGINFKGDVLRTGDWVHLLNPDNPAKPIIAQIWKTYKRPDSPQRCLSVCWYYRPEETVHPASRMFYENEVFKTGVFLDHAVEDFVSRCCVMFLTKYTRGRPLPPIWAPGLPLYVCEHRYKDDAKAFKKIKSWNSCVPEEIRKQEYEFEEYADGHVDHLKKVQSPFVRGLVGPGGLDGAAAGAQPAYRFLQDGKPATAEELQAQQAAAAVTSDLAAGGGAMDVDVSSADAAFFDLSSFASPSTANADGAPSQLLNFNFDQPAASSSPAPARELAPTPAELAASSEFFAPLPPGIKSKFRSDALGDLLWFTAPAADVPAVERPTHSLEYLYWRAQQKAAAVEAA
ncbi:hypothetical protein JCM10213_004270 [Rhodosporidiobolus nylandii]